MAVTVQSWTKHFDGEDRGEAEELLAGVIAAARREFGVLLEYRVDAPEPSDRTAVSIDADDGRSLGCLVAARPLDDGESRAVRMLARLLAGRLSRPGQAELRLRRQATSIARILDRRSVDTALQPIVDLESGRVVGVEALARFPDTPGVSPEVWFAEAESAGLSRPLEWLAAHAALRHFGQLPEGMFMSINASPDVAGDRCLRELMRGLPHERLVIEVTEHAPVEDYDRLNRKLQRRREEGVRLAVDDAGAGFASLRHLVGLRPSIIKLDISLIRGIDNDGVRQSLAGSLVSFGKSAGAEILAEGVETAGELKTVRALGIRFAQGFLLGRPEPPGTVPNLAA